MDTAAAKTFRYIRSGRLYIGLDQAPLGPLRLMLSRRGRLALDSLGVDLKQTVRDVLLLLRNRLRRSDGRALRLTARGQLALAVHQGHKVFDLATGTVTKTFAASVSDLEARAEIDACRRAGEVAAAPRFIEAGGDSRWYTEEFICGIHGTDTEIARNGRFMEFYDAVERCLLDLVAVAEPVEVEAGAYIEELGNESCLGPWMDAGIDEQAVDEIGVFNWELTQWLLHNQSQRKLQLVLSHGDFGLVNVIVADGEFRVIDWEGVRYGSLLADCFNFAFVEKYYARANGDVTREMAEICERYLDAVVGRHPELCPATELSAPFAMRLYYLERMQLLLKRDISSNLLRVIRNSIRMFREFDACAGYPPLTTRSG